MTLHDQILTRFLAQPEETRNITLENMVKVETEYNQHVLFATAKGKLCCAKPYSLGNWLINTKYSNTSFFYPWLKVSRSERKEKLLLSQLNNSAGGRKKPKFCNWQLAPPPRVSKQPPREKPDIPPLTNT